jgi:hypothetical protein
MMSGTTDKKLTELTVGSVTGTLVIYGVDPSLPADTQSVKVTVTSIVAAAVAAGGSPFPGGSGLLSATGTAVAMGAGVTLSAGTLSISVPAATTSVAGIVKPDGVTLGVSGSALTVLTAAPALDSSPVVDADHVMLAAGTYKTAAAWKAYLSLITATGASTITGAPSSGTVGVAITGASTTLTPTGATAFASLSQGGVEQAGGRTSFVNTATIPSLTPSAPSASTTIGIYASSTGGSPLVSSGSINVVQAATGATLAGIPTTGTGGIALNMSGATAALTPSGSTAYAVLSVSGSDEGSRVAFTGSAPPALIPLGAGTYLYKAYGALTGGSALATSPSITVAAGTETLTVTTPGTQAAGTAFALAGTYTNGPPTALDYSLDSGSTWTAASSPTIASGGYSFSITIGTANASQTVKVRDHNTTSISATSGAFVVSVPGVGPNLTMVGATYDTSAPKFGSGALSGGAGSAALTIAAGSRTVECWFKTSSGAPSSPAGIVMDSTGQNGMAVSVTGTLMAYFGGFSKITSVGICDGAQHHLALVEDSSGSSPHGSMLYVDGVFAGGDNYVATPANPTIVISAAGGATSTSGGASTGLGTIDEVAIYSTVKYPGGTTFTPPGVHTGSESGLVALWHLDGSGNSGS